MPDDITTEMVEAAAAEFRRITKGDGLLSLQVTRMSIDEMAAHHILAAARAVDPLVAENQRLRAALVEAQAWMERSERVNGNWSRSSAPLDLIRAALEVR